MAEREEELKSLLMKVKEWKSWLKTQHSKNYDHGIWSHYFMVNRRWKTGNGGRPYFLVSKITADSDCSHKIKTWLLLGRKAMTNLDHILKNRDCHFANKGPHSQSYGFSSSQVWMWELDHKEDWALKNWYFWTTVLEKTLESHLDCKKIKTSQY